MCKRLFIILLVASLPMFLAGIDAQVFAGTGPDWTDDIATDPDAYQGLPDTLDRSARFLVLDGIKNNGLGEFGDGALNTLTLSFEPEALAAFNNEIRIGLFDPNSVGWWDQRVDGSFLSVPRAPDVIYELYKDPLGEVTENLVDGNPNNDPEPWRVVSAYTFFNPNPLVPAAAPGTAAADAVWCALLTIKASDQEIVGNEGLGIESAVGPAGRATIAFRARLAGAPDPDWPGLLPYTTPENIRHNILNTDRLLMGGAERAGYKIAFNGTYLVPPNSVLGFAGGAVDEDVVCESSLSTGIPTSDDPPVVRQPNDDDWYFDGIFNFHIHSTQACQGDIDFMDADADWQATVTENEIPPAPNPLNNGFLSLDNNLLTGIPPDTDGVAKYIRPFDSLCGGRRDVTHRLVGGPLAWSIFHLPGGYSGHEGGPTPAQPTWTSDKDAGNAEIVAGELVPKIPAVGHPSFTAALVPGRFQHNLLDDKTFFDTPGLYCLRWSDVDEANFVWMKFNHFVGTTPIPQYTIRVFCDDNEDCKFDPGEGPHPLEGVDKTKVLIRPVACDTLDPLPGSQDIEMFTDEFGWIGDFDPDRTGPNGESGWGTPIAIRPGCYRVTLVVDAEQPFKVVPCATNPTYFIASVPTEEDSEECPHVDIPVVCKTMVCGDVYCEENGDCEYDPAGTDGPLPAGYEVTITATPPPGSNLPSKSATVLAPKTAYCIEGLEFDIEYMITYSFKVDPLFPPLLPAIDCPTSKSITLKPGDDVIQDCDWGFLCKAMLCGTAYCEEGEDCIYNPVVDEPLPVGTVVLITATNQVDPLDKHTTTLTVTVEGEYEWCIDGLTRGATYNVTAQITAGPVGLLLSGSCEEICVKTIPPEGQPDDCEFGYDCYRPLCVNVYCEEGGDCEYDDKVDRPLPIGTKVTVTATNVSDPLDTHMDFIDVTAANQQVRVCFDRLPIGETYQVMVDITAGPNPNMDLVQACNEICTVIIPPERNPKDCEFGYDCFTEICGRVYCDIDRNGAWSNPPDQGLVGWTVEAYLESDPANAAPRGTAITGTFGSYLIEDLPTGSYRVEVVVPVPDPTNGNLSPLVLPGIHTPREGCDVDFLFDCPSAIYGTVYCDSNCNGRLDPGETRLPDYTVNAVGPNGVLTPAKTDVNGDYSFLRLVPGTYLVSIVEAEYPAAVPAPAGLIAPDPKLIQVFLLARQVKMDVNFGALCPGKIFGYVFEDTPRQDCDGVYQPGADTPVDGAVITLVGPDCPKLPYATTTMSDTTGYYEFDVLPTGNYEVKIELPLPAKWAIRNLNLTEFTTPQIQTVILPELGEERRDFGFCTAAVSGKVFKQPYGFWDEDWDPGVDTPLEGVLVELLGVSGNALGYFDTTRTDAQGDYGFEDIPTGEYEITVSDTDGQTITIVTGLITDGALIRTPDVGFAPPHDGLVITDLDFAYCEPCDDQKLCAKVFCEPQGTCDGRFDRGVDDWVAGVTIEVLDPETLQVVATGKTNKRGRVCFEELDAGTWLIRVDEDSAPLDGWSPSTKVQFVRELEVCEELTVKFGFCKDCPRTYCCEGDLHEVIVESRHWVGDCPDGLDVNVWFYRGCDWSVLLDQIEVETTHPLPEKVTGVGEILTLEDIQVEDGIATIRVRVTATGPRFPVGRFGSKKYRLAVAINGDWVSGCEVFRAEKMRPGLLFPWDCKCEQQRDCCTCLKKGEKPKCDWSEWAKIDWDAWDRSDCNTWGMFGVLDVYCYRDWRECNPCECEEECGRCKGGVTELKLRLTAAEDAKVTITSDHGVLFDQKVRAGHAFSISGNGPEGRMGDAVWLFINGEDCGDIPTNCCEDVKVGMRFGWLWVEGGQSLKGGALCRWDNKCGDPGCKCKPECDPCGCQKCGKRNCKKSGRCECDCEKDKCGKDKCGKDKCDCGKCGKDKCDCRKCEKSCKSGKSGKSDCEKSGKSGKSGKSDCEKSGKSGKSGKSECEKSGKSGKSGKSECEKSGKSGKSGGKCCDRCGKDAKDCGKSRCDNCGNCEKDCKAYRCKSCDKCAQVCDSNRCDGCGDCSKRCSCSKGGKSGKSDCSEKSSRKGRPGKSGKSSKSGKRRR